MPRPEYLTCSSAKKLTRRVKLTHTERNGAVLGMPCSELALALGHVPQVAGQPGVVCLRTRQLPIFIKVGVSCCSGGRAQARTQHLDIDVRRDIERNGLHHAALEQRQALSATALLAVLLPHARALASWP